MNKLFVGGVCALSLSFVVLLMTGNDTQNVSKLFSIMQRGMAGNESVQQFDGIFDGIVGNTKHDAYDGDVARSFYNLASEFYEYGWGQSFHFGVRHVHEPHRAAISNSQNYLAQKLKVKDMDRVLDMGCGIGGPMRGVVRATGANITGLTINEYQIKRGREITSALSPWMQKRCHFSLQDYLNVKGLEEEAFDAAFYMESSLHCENRTQTFSEAYRLLKPGGRLVAMEYVTLDGWKPEDPKHQELMRLNIHGNGCTRTPSVEEDLAMVRAAGFEIVEHFDLMAYQLKIYGDAGWPWWADLQANWPHPLRVTLLSHPWVRAGQTYLLGFLATLRIIPADVYEACRLLNMGADGLSGLGKLGAITPEYYVGAVKPFK